MITCFDSHTHLNQELLFPDRKEHLLQFIQQWGRGLVNAGANWWYNERGILIAEEAKNLFPECRVKTAVGFHPCDVKSLGRSLQEALAKLKNQISTHRWHIVAIGECGIDLHFDTEWKTLDLQKEVFQAQCELAREVNLPIVIHSRDAFDQTFDILKNYSDLIIYFHCWGYGINELQKLIDKFPRLFVWFCGNISYPKADNLRESVRILPQNQLLIETDAPYLSPQEVRGQMNTPKNIVKTGQFIAKILHLEEKQLWKQVEENFWSLYRK